MSDRSRLNHDEFVHDLCEIPEIRTRLDVDGLENKDHAEAFPSEPFQQAEQPATIAMGGRYWAEVRDYDY